MLLVQTNNNKEQSSLEEEFSRQENLFIVPITKTSQVSVILEGILFQVFGQTSSNENSIGNQGSKISQKVEKMCKFINNTLKLNFSLSLIREIFEIIRTEEKKMKLYEEYIFQMNKRIIIDDDEDQQIFTLSHHQGISRDLQNQFQVEFAKGKESKVRLSQEIAGIQLRIESDPLIQPNKKQIKLEPVFQICCIGNSYKEQQAKSMHTLKSQLATNLPLQHNFLSSYKIGLVNNYENDEQSFHGSQEQTQHSIPHTSITNSEQRVDKDSDQYFYCPQWKKQECKNKKVIRSLVGENKSLNDSKFIQNLSGRVHPIPSFLHEQSIGQMILKEKKQDLRKSNIMKNSLKGIEQSKNTQMQNAYIINLRQIKYQNKIKRSSKNILSKKDIRNGKQELRQQKPMENQEIQEKIRAAKLKLKFKQKKQTQSVGKQFSFFQSQHF